MAADTIKVGLIGAGGNTRLRHLPGLNEQAGVEIITVANRSLESSQRAADEFNIPHAASNWEEVIYNDDVDAICIGTWPYLHATTTIAALDAGKHVMCEARMAMNSLEAHAMLDTAKANPGQIAQIVPAPHTLSIDATIKDMIGNGYIGELITLNAAIAQGASYPDSDTPLHWRQDRDLSGNNIMAMGIWYEAMMRWVGPARTVSAVGQTLVNHRTDDDGHRVPMTIPDHVDVICQMEVGGQMRYSLSNVLGHARPVDIFIHGTEGTIHIASGGPAETGGLQLSAARRGDDELSPVTPAADKIGGWRVEEEFINAIRGIEPITHTDFYDGVRYMEWTDAVTRSVRTGETVVLPSDGA